jgi:hypothetical protein
MLLRTKLDKNRPVGAHRPTWDDDIQKQNGRQWAGQDERIHMRREILRTEMNLPVPQNAVIS